MLSSEKLLSFGSLLGKLRRQHGLRQADIAVQMGCTRAFISQIERGTKIPSSTWLGRLSIALGASESEVVALLEAAEFSRGVLRFPDGMPLSLRREFVRLTQCVELPSLGSWAILERDLSRIAPASE
ncbi:helix-turn-helix domain-containing protein [Sulfurirhabdus autotrophica]|uniref:Helix-turn-helix protein n=1 Tax=Sulfurirhabdus autotrophica TaxID=1706046 RepID=A0A4R3XRV2_9PROT|nr:helix-turn-helix transcriptional regulator [Sulfurirhabdus autotrophica]TCV81062.1 helix-turn-helix protein [Sulfurirhabdus autotrophica]